MYLHEIEDGQRVFIDANIFVYHFSQDSRFNKSSTDVLQKLQKRGLSPFPFAKHSEINWNKVISDTLWNYVKKIKLVDSITSKSKLTDKDVEAIDHAIKADLIKKYQKA